MAYCLISLTLAANGIEQRGPLAILEERCFECHDETTRKGNVRLDNLEADFSGPESARRWTAVYDQIATARMPPKKKLQPETAAVLTGTIKTGLLAAETKARAENGRTALRRLNRVEYENSVHDLLGIKVDLKELLPEDPSSQGFDNSADAQHISSILLDRYLEAADRALDAAIVNRAKPETKSGVYRYDQSMIPTYLTKSALDRGDAMVFFDNVFALKNFKVEVEGLYRIRVHASGHQSQGKPVYFSVQDLVPSTSTTRTFGYFEAPSEEPAAIELTANLRPATQIRIAPYFFSVTESRAPVPVTRPGLAVYSIEVEGPLIPEWPPASYRKIFGNIPLEKVSPKFLSLLKRGNVRELYQASSNQPEEDVKKVLGNILPRAFRRPVLDEESKIYTDLALARLKEGGSFESAIRVGLKAILCSPSFLFLQEAPGPLDDFARASRLSYFLWSTMPDEELFLAALNQQLSKPAVLKAQVERLLKSPKARQFTDNYTGQWLGLREIDATSPDKTLYPEFDEWLQLSMVEETHRFFDEILTSNLSVMNFIQSDFAMLNERLAFHYGLAGVKGLGLRKVALPAASHRGGVLTQAAILKVTANGTTSSPVIRGAWVMRNILGEPIPPPPESVPAIEPDIRGAKNIRDQLSKHRAVAECASCHDKMDPPGLALENFDVIGGWRENYRILGGQIKADVKVNGRVVTYRKGAQIDASGVLSDNTRFSDIDELKERLLTRSDSIAKCVVEKLLTYATGRAPGFAERESVQRIVENTRSKQFGLRSLIHEVVQSDLFLNK
ncbi:MAG: hypothetical protein JWL90_2860 [Chthoniobacteraceae bacterium]|nr:hypothetical protein [Chthoniobacteraceae bacterium]